MLEKTKIQCLVEKWLLDQIMNQSPDAATILEEFSAKDETKKKQIHYIVTLGGDGTILYAAKQFPGNYIPPIISLAMVRNIKVLTSKCNLGISGLHV